MHFLILLTNVTVGGVLLMLQQHLACQCGQRQNICLVAVSLYTHFPAVNIQQIKISTSY